MRIIFYFWNSITFLLSVYILVAFWPDYRDNEFPLFTDMFTVIVFMPCFYLLCVGFPSQFFVILIRSPLKRLAVVSANFVIVLLIVISLFPYSIKASLFISFLSFIIISFHLSISYFLYYNSSSIKSA